MPDQSIPYVLESDYGRIVWNDPGDPDYIGLLDMETGVTHSISHSMSVDQVPDGEGQRHGRSRMGGMTVTLQGSLFPDPPALLWDKEKRLRMASRALESDGLLRYTPPDGIERVGRFRRMEDPSFTGRRARRAQVLLTMELPYVEASALSSLEVLPGDTFSGGFSDPVTDPWVETGATAGTIAVDNQGNREAWPVFRINGPCQNPGALNVLTGKELRVLRTLQANEFLLVDTRPTRRSVWLGTRGLGTASEPTNLVSNPSAETTIDGNGVGSSSGQPVATYTRDNTVWAKAGSWSRRTQWWRNDTVAVTMLGPGTPLATVGAPVVPGRYYGARVFAYIEKMDVAMTSNALRLYWYKADGTATAANSITVGPAIAASLGIEHERHVVGLAPPDAAFAAVRLSQVVNPAGVASEFILRADAFALFDLGTATKPVAGLSLASAIPAYFDGDTPDFGWTGTPHASTSQPLIDLGTGQDVYGDFDFYGSEWWPLMPGVNDVQFVAFSTSTGAKLTTSWRHAYEGLT